MIAPNEVGRAAKRLEDENLRFRSFLKIHADGDELDARFRRLHEALFADYDCRQCANCCRDYRTTVERGEISGMARALDMTADEFAQAYLIRDITGEWEFAAPCPMLREGGACLVQACKPRQCRDFPYTDKPDRLESLYGVLEFAGVCPVVFEILQRLKQMYRFRR